MNINKCEKGLYALTSPMTMIAYGGVKCAKNYIVPRIKKMLGDKPQTTKESFGRFEDKETWRKAGIASALAMAGTMLSPVALMSLNGAMAFGAQSFIMGGLAEMISAWKNKPAQEDRGQNTQTDVTNNPEENQLLDKVLLQVITNKDTLKVALSKEYATEYPNFANINQETCLTKAFIKNQFDDQQNDTSTLNANVNIIVDLNKLNTEQQGIFCKFNENGALAEYMSQDSHIKKIPNVLEIFSSLDDGQQEILKQQLNNPLIAQELIGIAGNKGGLKQAIENIHAHQDLLNDIKFLSKGNQKQISLNAMESSSPSSLDSLRLPLLEVMNSTTENKLQIAEQLISLYFQNGITGPIQEGSTTINKNPFIDSDGNFHAMNTIDFLKSLAQSEGQGIFPIFCVALKKITADYRLQNLGTPSKSYATMEQFSEHFFALFDVSKDIASEKVLGDILKKEGDLIIPLLPLLSRNSSRDNQMGHYYGFTLHRDRGNYKIRMSNPSRACDQEYTFQNQTEAEGFIQAYQEELIGHAAGDISARLQRMSRSRSRSMTEETFTNINHIRQKQTGNINCGIYSMLRELPLEVFQTNHDLDFKLIKENDPS